MTAPLLYNRIVVGIDESYSRTGISIAADGKLLKVSSVDFKGCRNKTEKRKELSRVLSLLLPNMLAKANVVVIVCERIRTFTGKQSQLRPKYLISTGALIATIVDTAYEFGVEVYSTTTGSWKSQIVGTSKPAPNSYGVDPKKWPTILFVKKLGFNVASRNKKGNLVFNDDAADSACIALYGFIPEKLCLLQLEE